MKKMFRIVTPILLVALLCSALAVVAMADTQLPAQCAHCKQDVTWAPLSENISGTAIPAGHYYVDTDGLKVTNMSVAKSTSVCIYMNGNSVEADGVDRVFSVSGTLTVMGEGTVKGYGRSSSLDVSDRYGGTVYIPTGGTFNLYDATVTGVKITGSKASNGGNINIYGTFNMYSGVVSNGYASNCGGNIFVSPAGKFYMYGGSITGGTCSTGKSVCAQGKVLLSGNASVNHLYLWDKNSVGFDNILTVKGVYTGVTNVELRSTTAAADLVVGTSDNAKLRGTLNFNDSGLYTKIAEGKLVLTEEDPSLHNGYCQYCKTNANWSLLSEANAEDTTLSTGHYYLDFLESTDEWVSKEISGTVCLDLNGQTLVGATRAFTVPKNATLNIQGEGTVAGRGVETTSSASRYGGTINVASGGILNLYAGLLTSEKTDGKGGNNGGAVYTAGTFNMYGGKISGGYASNTGGNVFIAPAGVMNAYGGTVGAAAKGTPVYCQGSLLLSGDASLSKVYLTYKSGGPSIDSMLTVKGTYSGSSQLEFNTTLEEGTVLGISDNADLSHASMIIENTTLYLVPDGNQLKLASSVAVITKPGHCDVCDKDVTWTALMEPFAGQTTISSGHYYLDFAGNSTVWDQKTINGKVCLDLNGMTLTGATRVFVVDSGSILNLMGDGTLIGRGRKSSLELNDRTGGTIDMERDSVLNQYGGKLTFQKVDGQSAGNGGVVNVAGTYNLYGGSVENGQSAWVGGNIFVTTRGCLNLYGGKIVGGTASQSGNSIACRGRVMLTGDAQVNELYLYPNTADGGPALSEMLTVSGKYTGSVKLRVSSIKNGMDVGTSDNADISGATVTTTSTTVTGMAIHGNDLIVIGINRTAIVEGTTVIGTYANFAEALAAYDSVNSAIVLFDDVNEDIVLQKDVYVDLNGFDITGTVSGEGTLYCMDAFTDDFTVADGIYGTVKVSDNVKAVPQEAPCATYGYLMIVSDGKASFHCVKLKIASVSLRPSQAGLYYSCNFAGDEMVAEKVSTFGVVVSVEGDPMLVDGVVGRTSIEKSAFGADATATSTLIKGILKTGNTDDTNATNADTRIYGRTYIQLDDEIIYGPCFDRTFREQICGSQSMYGVDRMWDALTSKQKRGVMDMVTTYASVMETWEMPNISNAVENRDDAAEDVLAQRRAQVVAKMRAMGDIYWRATEDVKYRISSTARWVEFKAGRIYRGMPYAYARSDQYTFMEFAGEPDEKGIYPISGLTTTHLGNGSTYARIGNDCSGSVNFAWSSVGADISGTNSSRYMIEANGYYKVGDYEYTPTEDGRVGISKEIVAANGKERMFEAYAKVQPGDGLDTMVEGGGHVILVVDKHVVYNADGSINGDKSYIHTLEQTPGPVSITVQQHSYNEALDEVVYDIYIEKKTSFNGVYNSGYLPITVNVLTDPSPVPEANVVDSLDASQHTYENIFKGDLTCSRMISSVTITVTDENGQVFSYTGSGIRASIRKYYMQNFLTEDPAVMRGTLELDKLVAGNDYHCTVVVALASGDRITVRDFDFTATDVDISIPEGTVTPEEPEEPEDNGDGVPDEGQENG